MPGWHEATKQLQEEGEVQVVGIVQEQHPERCKLFMQWKQMGWPVLVDAYNLLEVSVVPITLGIDEFGVVHKLPRDPAELPSAFLEQTFASPAQRATRTLVEPERDPARAIRLYTQAIERDPQHAAAHFRLGVAYRMRYDWERRQPGDFQKAVEGWQRALDLNPNQYIWRRRIEQYGPLPAKPYPFYDWVAVARKEIAARGETPVKLNVEPGETERAGRRPFKASGAETDEPDAAGRITRDESPLIDVEAIVVPPALKPGGTARVHVVFRPRREVKAHWNNEAGALVVWVNPPGGWQIDSRRQTVPNAAQEVSLEPRTVELEVRCPADAKPGLVSMPAYALYYVCEGVDGTCLYRRQDVSVMLEVRK